MTAMEIRAYRNLNTKLVRIEELDKLMVNLIEHGIGFKEEEDFLRKEEMKLRGLRGSKLRKEMIIQIMKTKLRDNRILGDRVRGQRNKTSLKTSWGQGLRNVGG